MAESFSSFNEDDASLDGLCNGKQLSEITCFPSAISKPDSKAKRRSSIKPSLETVGFLNPLHGSDPVKVELNQLENEVKGHYMDCSRERCSSYFIFSERSGGIWKCLKC
ncbi:hypothetical protein O6H91_12G051500 [Diphasiastrum complanatum]|uniref:Uncharacterized protein n=1 Tax=Diphasiastrum complanatum TaxID=34168 RepID=A0ACC2C1Q9_DIPCM|nr:hypothetical protein O6H91_12G051500 [Diphasiastrum complanatum]